MSVSRAAEVREIYECKTCGFQLKTYVPTIEATCPKSHTVKNGTKKSFGKVLMVRIYCKGE